MMSTQTIHINCPNCLDEIDATHAGSFGVQIEDGAADAWDCAECGAEVWTDANGNVLGTAEQVDQ